MFFKYLIIYILFLHFNFIKNFLSIFNDGNFLLVLGVSNTSELCAGLGSGSCEGSGSVSGAGSSTGSGAVSRSGVGILSFTFFYLLKLLRIFSLAPRNNLTLFIKDLFSTGFTPLSLTFNSVNLLVHYQLLLMLIFFCTYLFKK